MEDAFWDGAKYNLTNSQDSLVINIQPEKSKWMPLLATQIPLSICIDTAKFDFSSPMILLL